jgi:superfamily I DNA/RNA helicase
MSWTLTDKIHGYELEQPDDIDEFRKLEAALKPNGEWHSYTLKQFASIASRENQLRVETLHSSKGQQRKVVIIAMAEMLNAVEREAQISNRRLMYVGMTK